MSDAPRPTAYRVADAPHLGVTVVDLGLACCAMELGAAISRGMLVPEDPDVAADVRVLVVSGTVTDALIPAVLHAWEAMPDPKAVLSFGSCANSGGPYWDAPTVLNGVDRIIPVATYVPGCPPRPEGLIAGLVALAGTVAA